MGNIELPDLALFYFGVWRRFTLVFGKGKVEA